MQTIKTILISSKERLREACAQSYALEAEILLADILKISREKVVAYPERILSDDEIARFNANIERRLNNEPIAYILGKREFWSLDFIVTKDTLIPRPDSETLIEAVIDSVDDKNKEFSILDLGTGSGCLILSILNEFPKAYGLAIDINPASLEVAKQNSVNLGLANRVRFMLNSWTEGVTEKFDIIISNPPYIKNHDIENLSPEVRFFEPRLALSGGESGFDAYKIIAENINKVLKPDGLVFIEAGINQDMDIKSIFTNHGLEFKGFRQDLSGINRCVSFKKTGE